MRIIYPDGDTIAVVIPAPTVTDIEVVAHTAVPAGLPYRIVETGDLPQDRTNRHLWTADFTEPDGISMGAEAWFAAQAHPEEDGQ